LRFGISFDFFFYDAQDHDMMHNIYKKDTPLILGGLSYMALSCLMFMGKMSGADPSNAVLVSFLAVVSVGW